MYLHLLRNKSENLAKGSLFYLFLKLIQRDLIFSDNIHILYKNTPYSFLMKSLKSIPKGNQKL
jgi:hypothetical protein